MIYITNNLKNISKLQIQFKISKEMQNFLLTKNKKFSK